MTKKEFTNNANLYQKQISEVLNNVLASAGPEWADAIYKELVGYAKGASVWYVDSGVIYDIPSKEELKGVADALSVHVEPLKEFIEEQGGLTNEVVPWYEFAEGVRLYAPE